MRVQGVRMVIVEDDIVVRSGMSNYFSQQKEMSEVYAVESMEQYKSELIGNFIPDIVLIDIGLPGMSGIDGIRFIKERSSHTEILMYTVFRDTNRIFKSLCAGASGYVLKGTPFPDIKQAVMDILSGGSFMSPAIARKVIDYFNPPRQTAESVLTSREKQIVQGLVDGLSYKMVADRLSVSIDTIRFHIKNIYAKLQVNSKSEVISKSLRGEI